MMVIDFYHDESYQPFLSPTGVSMRAITTNEITNVVSLINKAKELKTAHSLSIRTLMHLQAQADTLYHSLIGNIDFESQTKMLRFFNDLEDACSTFDELVEEYRHNEYINDITTHWLNGEYVALPDTIRRSK
jgi:phage terminase large subunit